MAAQETITEATSQDDVADVKELFLEYAKWLGDDLCFQGFDEEMETFPEFYTLLLIAHVGGKVAGAVGLKNLGDGICEMKRLYVRDAFKGRGLGRKLSEALIQKAKARGFDTMRLDTLPKLEAAIALYLKLDFRKIPAYYHNPIEGVVYMEKPL